MAEVNLLPVAYKDYRAALGWYVQRNVRAAAGFEAAIAAGLQKIADNPDRWPLCDDRHRFYMLRRYPYSLVYRIVPAGPLIVAVAHSSRDSSFWQGR